MNNAFFKFLDNVSANGAGFSFAAISSALVSYCKPVIIIAPEHTTDIIHVCDPGTGYLWGRDCCILMGLERQRRR